MATNPIDEEARLKRLAALAARCDARALLANIEARAKEKEKSRAVKAARAQAASVAAAAAKADHAKKKEAADAAKARRRADANAAAQKRLADLDKEVCCYICDKMVALRHYYSHLEAHHAPKATEIRQQSPARVLLDPERLTERRAQARAARRQRDERPD